MNTPLIFGSFRIHAQTRKSFTVQNTPIDEIDISKLDIDFISLARIPTAYGFLEYCRSERGNDTAARARKVVSIKRFYRYLKVQGYIDENPMQDLESPKIKKSLPKYLSLEQAVSLLEAVDGKIRNGITAF